MVTCSSRTMRWKRTRISRAVLLSKLAGGLVRQDELRPVGERARDAHPLLLAARHFVGPVVEPLAQPHQFQALERARGGPCTPCRPRRSASSTFS